MKKYLFLLTLFTFNTFCQISKKNQQTSVDSISSNKVNLYFKEKIPENLLKNITFPKNNTNIEISFFVNKEKIPFNIQVNSVRNTSLNNALINAFKKYPLNNFDINFDTRKKYSFQIISKGSNSNIINYNNSISETSPVNCNSCKDLDFFPDIETCIHQKINDFFYEKIDYSLAKTNDYNTQISLKISLFIDQNGFLKLKTVEAPTEFKEHIKNIVKKYSEIFTPKTKDNNSIPYDYKYFSTFKAGGTPKKVKIFNNFDSIFNPSTKNKFSEYLSKNLKVEEINNANLNRINKILYLYFELDKKGKPFQITTNSRSKELEEKIISLFKNYDLNNFIFFNKKKLNKYFSPIIIFENDKNIIKTNNIIGYSRSPIFPVCNNSKTTKEAYNCFSKQIQSHFIRKFNTKLPNKLGLSTGRKKVFINFRINKKGKIDNIKVRAPHIKIKEEVIRVMSKLPKVSPGIFGNKPVNIKYSIPFTLLIE